MVELRELIYEHVCNMLPADVVGSMHGDGEHVNLASVREASQIFFEALRDTLAK